MTQIDTTTIWIIIVGLAIGSYLLRFTFIGLVGDRPMPPWLLRHLRYTAVAIIPALIAPLVVWPSATDGQPDLPRMAAAAIALTVGYATKNILAAIFTGAATLYGLLYLVG
ncbi:Branched-chain amino acid transport protein [Ruegeria halocynthiae]|uniref:Branched-chain amino acid transport protein n=1 Tax=Ruegeria halocynthiae TaxID=985054 RepID=A0A1H2ZDB8_9RHOB|nr:AzlD domain-containing protein [Ruegeria halocynthiae]SDX15390.1 Branched-chain amino acid transport protein [Ruegeria halocynthiae]